MRVDIKKMDKLIFALGGCFVWEESPQGHAYWNDIREQLKKIRDLGEMHEELEVRRRKAGMVQIGKVKS